MKKSNRGKRRKNLRTHLGEGEKLFSRANLLSITCLVKRIIDGVSRKTQPARIALFNMWPNWSIKLLLWWLTIGLQTMTNFWALAAPWASSSCCYIRTEINTQHFYLWLLHWAEITNTHTALLNLVFLLIGTSQMYSCCHLHQCYLSPWDHKQCWSFWDVSTEVQRYT